MADMDSWILALSSAVAYCNQKITGGISNITVTQNTTTGQSYLHFLMTDNTTFDVGLSGVLTDPQKAWVIDLVDELTKDATTNDLLWHGIPINNLVFGTLSTFTEANENKIYVDVDENKLYRYDTTLSDYVSVGGSGNGFAIWLPSTDYKTGDYVIYDRYLYQVNTDHTSTTIFDESKFDVIISDRFQFISQSDYDTLVTNNQDNPNTYYFIYNSTGSASSGGSSTGGTSNYEDLSNKPQINGVLLQGNKSLSELGIDELSSTEIDSLINFII